MFVFVALINCSVWLTHWNFIFRSYILIFHLINITVSTIYPSDRDSKAIIFWLLATLIVDLFVVILDPFVANNTVSSNLTGDTNDSNFTAQLGFRIVIIICLVLFTIARIAFWYFDYKRTKKSTRALLNRIGNRKDMSSIGVENPKNPLNAMLEPTVNPPNVPAFNAFSNPFYMQKK